MESDKSLPGFIAGQDVETRFARTLETLGADPVHDKVMDRRPYQVDFLIRHYQGKTLPKAVGVQLTLELDNPHKMQDFLDATSFTPDDQHVYIEVWSSNVAPCAAEIVARLLADWQARSANTERPSFLRVGPTGAWISDSLRGRIDHVLALRQDHHPERRQGLIVELRNSVVSVQVPGGLIVRIPIRFARKGVRLRLHKAQDENKVPQNTRVSFLPGKMDASGTPVFVMKFV